MAQETVAGIIAKKPGRQARGCAVCGEPTVAQVVVQIRQLNQRDRSASATGTRTESKTLCEPHAVEAFQSLASALGVEL